MTPRALALDGIEPEKAPKRKRTARPKRRTPRPTSPPMAMHGFEQTAESLSQRAQALMHLVRPLRDDERSTLPCHGMLPHGKPLFLDGSTQCATCSRLMFYEHLRDGKCLPCAACKNFAPQTTFDRDHTCVCGIALEHHSGPIAEYRKLLDQRMADEAKDGKPTRAKRNPWMLPEWMR